MQRIDAKTKERIEKLPEWAQNLIYGLEEVALRATQAADHREEQDQNARIKTSVFSGLGCEHIDVKVAADEATLKLDLGKTRKGSAAELQVQIREDRGRTYLQVLAMGGGIGVRPSSSNVVEITVEDH